MSNKAFICKHKQSLMVNYVVGNAARLLGIQRKGAMGTLVERGIPRGLTKESAGIYTYYDLYNTAKKDCKNCEHEEQEAKKQCNHVSELACVQGNRWMLLTVTDNGGNELERVATYQCSHCPKCGKKLKRKKNK